MKCVILFSAVLAVCAAIPYRGKHLNVGEDGKLTATDESGKRVVIAEKKGSYGKEGLEIIVEGPLIPTKKIYIDDNNRFVEVTSEFEERVRDKRGIGDITQADTLRKIFKDHQGQVDETSYEQLLSKVSKAVETGNLNPTIYKVLKQLKTDDSDESSLVEQQPSKWQILQLDTQRRILEQIRIDLELEQAQRERHIKTIEAREQEIRELQKVLEKQEKQHDSEQTYGTTSPDLSNIWNKPRITHIPTNGVWDIFPINPNWNHFRV